MSRTPEPTTRGGAISALARRLRVLRGDDGFSLAEIMVAMGVGAIVMTAVSFGMAAALTGLENSKSATQATAMARTALENARAIGYDAAAHDAAALATDTYTATCGSVRCYGGEALVIGPPAPSPYVTTQTQSGMTFRIATYITWAQLTPSAPAKRISALVTWTERGRARRVTASSLLQPGADVGAKAYVLSGKVAGTVIKEVAPSNAPRGGGSQTNSAATFAPMAGVSGSGGSTSAATTVSPTKSGQAQAGAATVTIGITGLNLSVSGASVSVSSGPSGTSGSASGSVVINGVTYTNPAPGTIVYVNGYRVSMNDRRLDPDGSFSITLVRVLSPSGAVNAEFNIAYAWTRKAADLGS